MTNYNEAKVELREIALKARKEFKTDKPKINQIINDNCYWLEQRYNLEGYKATLLQNFACTLQV